MLSPRRRVVDKAVLATRIAAIRDAVARIGEVLPASAEALLADRTAREIVALNVFVALQESVSLAAHWLADEGLQVPRSYAEVFRGLGERGVIGPELATRLASSAGLRNLLAHQYGAVDFRRVHEIASTRLGDLLDFCNELARRAAAGS